MRVYLGLQGGKLGLLFLYPAQIHISAHFLKLSLHLIETIPYLPQLVIAF